VSYKWLLPVMAELVDGPKRHSELSRAVQLDHKRLGRVLRRAQEAQLVSREADVSGRQFSVRYRLTGYGRDLLSILAMLGSLTQSRDP
jgi:DNA-binding HxlR family transcriptional regulator